MYEDKDISGRAIDLESMTDINNPVFFQELLSKRPETSFGFQIKSKVGTAYRFGCVDRYLIDVAGGYKDLFYLTTIPKTALSLIEFCLYKLDQDIASGDFPAAAKEVYRQHRAVAKKALTTQKEKLAYSSSMLDAALTSRKAFYLATLSPLDLREFLTLYSEWFSNEDFRLFGIYYDFYRILIIGNPLAKKEGTWAALKAALNAIESLGQERDILETMYLSLEEYLDVKVNHYYDVIELIHEPEFLSAFQKYFNVNIADAFEGTEILGRFKSRTHCK